MNDKKAQRFMVGLNAAIVAVTEETPRVLTVPARELALVDESSELALPFGPLHEEEDRTLELGVRGWVLEQTGLDLDYVEQLYTFGDQNRHPIERRGGPRMISVAYLALVREGQIDTTSRAQWLDYYGFLPWEDWRRGRPRVIDQVMMPSLDEWVQSAPHRRIRDNRRERLAINFGLNGSEWDGEKVLERYELLYESGLVDEAQRVAAHEVPHKRLPLGKPMALDHRRMLATALTRLRGKIKYRPVVFELLPPLFTLFQLQRVVEALSGVRLHKQNFRRLVDKGGLVEGTGMQDRDTGGRPAELFRFRRDVLRERRAPGVGLPGGQ